MSRLSLQLGFWSACLSVVTFLVFTVCFIAVFVVNPIFSWTNLADLVRYTNQTNQLYKYTAQFAMLIFGALYVILLASIQEYAAAEKKVLARIAIYFGIMFATLSSINYFVQVSAVRLNIAKGQLEGLEQFVQGNPTSGIAAINMLGWTLFLGLSSLFVAYALGASRLERIAKYAFLANGIICLLGGVGYIFDIGVLVFLTMNFGMGGAVLVATIALSLFFNGERHRIRQASDGILP